MTRAGIGLVVFSAAIAMSHLGCKHSETASRDAGAMQGAPATAAQDRAVAAAAQPTAAAPTSASQVQGRIEAIDRGNNVVLAGSEAVGHAFDKFKVDDDTHVTINGEQAGLAELNEGDEVRASFSSSEGELHLDRIDVLTANDVSGSGPSR
jgi:hypothetical protein